MSALPEAPRRFSFSGWLVVVIAALVYGLTASRNILGGDNPEFVVVAAGGGVAHPPGFPLYVLYLRAMMWLPTGSAAHTTALATSLLGVACLAVLYRAARLWGASRSGAGAAVGIYAFSALAWQLSTQAEVFALNALIAAIILLLAAPGSPRGARATAALGLVAGLGLANHPSIVLLAPIGIYAAVRAAHQTSRPWRAVAAGLAALAIGMLPYLQLLIDGLDADAAWRWGETRSLGGMWHHMLRREFGTFSLGIYDGADPFEQMGALLLKLLRETLVVGTLAAVGGVAGALHLDEPDADRETRRSMLLLVLTFVLAGPVFVAMFNLPPTGLGARVVERFYLLPLVLLVIPMALGLTRVVGALEGRFDIRAAAVVVPTYVALVINLGVVRESQRPTVANYANNVLGQAAHEAIIVGTGDHRLYSILHAQHVLGQRPDVTYIDAALMLNPWYARTIATGLGFVPDGVDHEARTVSQREFLRSLVASGRPVCLANPYVRGAVDAVPLVPMGLLLCVPSASAPGPSIFDLEATNRMIFQKFTFESTPPVDGDSWAAVVYQDYARPWRDLAGAFERSGLAGPASRLNTYADSFTPWLASP